MMVRREAHAATTHVQEWAGHRRTGLVRKFFVVGSVALLLALASGLSPWPGNRWGMLVASVFGMLTACTLGMGCHMLYSSKVVKLKKCERLLDRDYVDGFRVGIGYRLWPWPHVDRSGETSDDGQGGGHRRVARQRSEQQQAR